MPRKPGGAPRSTASRAWGIDPARQAKVLSSETLFQGRVFSLRREKIAEPSGLVATREIVFHPGSVVVLPVLDDGRIVLIRQYRHAAGQYLWELVAGHKEPDEDPLEGAHRELQEETGYTAKRIKKLFEIFPSPGLLGERMDIFVAQGLTKGKARPEDDEKITQKILTLKQAERWIRSGKIRDAKSISGILFYSRFAAK
ncbi:MAG TPA: NUDIX hydrolase [Candidatus Acidoferrales bacterium]|nr:NUDIX hydrolase [Candidatus Acidoferrales bacterium]